MNKGNLEEKRWHIAIAAIVMQLCLGTVYAWSVFKIPLIATHGWGETAVQATIMIMMAVVGIAAAFGGSLVDRKGPRFVATLGGILFGIGTILGGLADQMGNIWLLYIGYGVIGGLGNGFGYVTPIATLIRWFPDKRGLVTGLAVMGFGAGAFFMGKIAPVMVNNMGVAMTLYIWGVIFLVLVTLSGQFYKNPPSGWLPAGFTPTASAVSAADSFTFGEAVKTHQWWMLWVILFLNISAGLGLISQLSPMAQDVVSKAQGITDPKALAIAGGTILAYASIFNGLGRLFWAYMSDHIGRRNVFVTMFISQVLLYIILPHVTFVFQFTAIACYLLACYGGGFATMPAFVADAFGPRYIGKIYGVMLTTYGCAGVVGPLVFSMPVIKPIALYIAAGLLFLGFLIAINYRPPKHKNAH
ncbi:MAG: OFA family MFS transporter [Syntrophaceae bacterium]|nr:OFA family MFS transporter [Syntrophaceae bacterium]